MHAWVEGISNYKQYNFISEPQIPNLAFRDFGGEVSVERTAVAAPSVGGGGGV